MSAMIEITISELAGAALRAMVSKLARPRRTRLYVICKVQRDSRNVDLSIQESWSGSEHEMQIFWKVRCESHGTRG